MPLPALLLPEVMRSQLPLLTAVPASGRDLLTSPLMGATRTCSMQAGKVFSPVSMRFTIRLISSGAPSAALLVLHPQPRAAVRRSPQKSYSGR